MKSANARFNSGPAMAHVITQRLHNSSMSTALHASLNDSMLLAMRWSTSGADVVGKRQSKKCLNMPYKLSASLAERFTVPHDDRERAPGNVGLHRYVEVLVIDLG